MRAVEQVLAVGTSRLSDHLWLNIRTERTPQIDSALTVGASFPLHDGGLWENIRAAVPFLSGPLFHRRLYSDPRFLKRLAVWYQAAKAPGRKAIDGP